MPLNRKCIISKVDSEDDVNTIVEYAKDIFTSDMSLSLFRITDFDYIKKLFNEIIKEDNNSNMFLCKFSDKDTGELVGAVLFSFGSPWYNPKIRFICEELTMSFKKGYGIARNIAAYMKYYVDNGLADIATGAASQEAVSNEIANSYSKFGYKEYPSFYLVNKTIADYNNEANR